MLEVKKLNVSLDGKKLLTDISFKLKDKEILFLSGHNGSGKTSLIQTIMGHSDYRVDSGDIIFNKKSIIDLPTTNRSLSGIFLASQMVPEIRGLSVSSFFKHILNAHCNYKTSKDLSAGEFFTQMKSAMDFLNIPETWLGRDINLGFSGGEKKRIALLALLLLKPKIAMLDEIDSGIDSDSLNLIIKVIKELKDTSFIIISHSDKMLKGLKYDKILKMENGRLV